MALQITMVIHGNGFRAADPLVCPQPGSDLNNVDGAEVEREV